VDVHFLSIKSNHEVYLTHSGFFLVSGEGIIFVGLQKEK